MHRTKRRLTVPDPKSQREHSTQIHLVSSITRIHILSVNSTFQTVQLLSVTDELNVKWVFPSRKCFPYQLIHLLFTLHTQKLIVIIVIITLSEIFQPNYVTRTIN